MRCRHPSIKRQDVASITNKSMRTGDFFFFLYMLNLRGSYCMDKPTGSFIPSRIPCFFLSLPGFFPSTGKDGIKSRGRMVSGWWLADRLLPLPLLLLLLPPCSAHLSHHLRHPFWPHLVILKHIRTVFRLLSLVFFPVFAPWDEQKYGEMCRAPCTVFLNFLPLFLIYFLIRFSYLCLIFCFFPSRGRSKTFVSTSPLVFSDSAPPPAPPTHSMMYTPCFLFCWAWMYHMWNCLFIYIYTELGTRSNILPEPEFWRWLLRGRDANISMLASQRSPVHIKIVEGLQWIWMFIVSRL